MLYPNVIISKKGKFRRLYDDINDFSTMRGRFLNVYPNLFENFSEEQKNTFSEFRVIFYDHSFEENDPRYVSYIERALDFLREILEIVPKPITFGNYVEMGSLEERYRFITNPEHNGFHLGSRFITYGENGEVIQKLSEEETEHIYGYVNYFESDLYDMPEWLSKMNTGMYNMNSFRFDVMRFTSFGQNDLESIKIYGKDSESHPIIPYLIRNDNEREVYEEKCSFCGDGSCVHCEPSRFIE